MSALFFMMGGFLVAINLAMIAVGLASGTTYTLLGLQSACLLIGVSLVGRGLFLVVSQAAPRGRLQRSR